MKIDFKKEQSLLDKRFICQLNSLKNHILSEDNTNLLPVFFDFNDKLDELRGEDFFTVFPELDLLKSFRAGEKLV